MPNQTGGVLCTYQLWFRLCDFPYDCILLVVASCQDLIAFEAKARAGDLGAASHGVIVFLLHY
jgi:hypothetical protein